MKKIILLTLSFVLTSLLLFSQDTKEDRKKGLKKIGGSPKDQEINIDLQSLEGLSSLHQLEKLSSLEQLESLSALGALSSFEQLSQLEALTSLDELESIEGITGFNYEFDFGVLFKSLYENRDGDLNLENLDRDIDKVVEDAMDSVGEAMKLMDDTMKQLDKKN